MSSHKLNLSTLVPSIALKKSSFSKNREPAIVQDMDSSCGGTTTTSSGGSTGLQEAMDQRKRKRMLSNRESARRSRQRKQKHLDDLSVQVAQLRKENGHILAALAVTSHNYMAVDAENSVLRTQMAELATRLHSLNDILFYMSINDGSVGDSNADDGNNGFILSEPWNQPPIMASAVDMFQYC